jgi:hypothetical protein
VKDTEEKDDGGFNFRTKAVTILVGLVFLTGVLRFRFMARNGDMQQKMAAT